MLTSVGTLHSWVKARSDVRIQWLPDFLYLWLPAIAPSKPPDAHPLKELFVGPLLVYGTSQRTTHTGSDGRDARNPSRLGLDAVHGSLGGTGAARRARPKRLCSLRQRQVSLSCQEQRKEARSLFCRVRHGSRTSLRTFIRGVVFFGCLYSPTSCGSMECVHSRRTCAARFGHECLLQQTPYLVIPLTLLRRPTQRPE